MSKKLNVSVFSGGRGSATITRELIRDSRVQLSVLVNAYDDGLSTGDLRDLIPGMLGPSDFRKNFSYLLDLYSAEQFALEKLIEYRLPKNFTREQFEELPALARGLHCRSEFPPALRHIFENLEPGIRSAVADYIDHFFGFYGTAKGRFPFADCSLGNLVFAGAYLESGRSFNQAVAALGALVGAKARVLNVTLGENRILVALKQDGEVLDRESKIVSPQSPSPIADIFLLEQALDPAALESLKALPLEGKRAALRARERPVQLSPAARQALLESDIVVYGPGTQFSSIYPSYKTVGLPDALAESPARVKAMVANLDYDHDIQGLGVTDLVDRTLQFMGDPDNQRRLVTHVLYNRDSAQRPQGVKLDPARAEGGRYKGARLVEGNFQNPARASVHSGIAVVTKLRELLEHEQFAGRKDLDIYISLNERSLAMSSLLQEFLELPWHETFSHVRLSVNNAAPVEVQLPPNLEFKPLDSQGLFSEVETFVQWLQSGTSHYLVTITGDGEYRLRDVLSNIRLLETTSFGAVFGSRNQSRRQFSKSLDAAYGESPALYWTSWAGALLLSALFTARYKVVFSDPLTGFRIYKRSVLLDSLGDSLQSFKPSAAGSITRLLIENNVEIAEVPVSYRTFKGFTNAAWRLKRGLKDVTSAL
ncbi:MAG TPA: 2-phospho-L-lactate transferase CofD family protein [Myxococcales bacterium]|nr:2-phospho-L-lactate transferase CofD family protein [Myxococcales bacterium]